MRIACLQFAPSLGNISQNIQRAEALLQNAAPQDLDILILPELAFTGYNFGSLSEISPHLEATAAGPSTVWARSTARRLNCYVTVGYPEIAYASEGSSVSRYNSVVIVSPAGSVIANYRKHHLYRTDETWAEEGMDGFFASDVSSLGRVAMGIFVELEGMDINPYRFIAPFRSYEFATHVLASSATLVLLPMAWQTSESASALQTDPKLPDTATIQYWQSRLQPLLDDNGDGREILVAACNRSGREGEVCYAGTSLVIGLQSGAIRYYGVLGRGVEDLLVVET